MRRTQKYDWLIVNCRLIDINFAKFFYASDLPPYKKLKKIVELQRVSSINTWNKCRITSSEQIHGFFKLLMM